MFRSFLTVIAVTIIQSQATQAAVENFDPEICLKHAIGNAEKQVCMVLNQVPPEYTNTNIEATQGYFCGNNYSRTTLSSDLPAQEALTQFQKMNDKAISGLIDAENQLPIQNQQRLKFAPWVSRLMSLRTYVYIANLACFLKEMRKRQETK